MHGLIGRTLRLTTGILARDERQLLPQLLGRLLACPDPAAPAFLDRARQLIKPPALLTQRLGLTPPGAETARLEGHTGRVSALSVLPDGRLASGSDDNTIRIWDSKTDAETARIEGCDHTVQALAALPDGRLVSGAFDGTVRFWDPKSGVVTARLEGHTGWVRSLAVLRDGRLASGSDDKTIRLWDSTSGKEITRLEVDAAVRCLCTLPATDGQGCRLVAGDALGCLHWLEFIE